jgi:hypothetical protein
VDHELRACRVVLPGTRLGDVALYHAELRVRAQVDPVHLRAELAVAACKRSSDEPGGAGDEDAARSFAHLRILALDRTAASTGIWNAVQVTS